MIESETQAPPKFGSARVFFSSGVKRVTSLRLRSAAESLSSATESIDRVMDPLLGIVILAVFLLTGLMGWLGNRR